jgi:outer membrane protein
MLKPIKLNTIIKITSGLSLIVIPFIFYGQETIGIDQLVLQTLAENPDIRVLKKNVEIADLQANKGNAGLLPQFNFNGGVTYQNASTRLNFAADAFPSIDYKGAYSWIYNTTLQGSYTLFDGFRGKYTLQILENQVNLAELQTLLQSEGILIQVVNGYTNLISLNEQRNTIIESIQTSLERLQRTEYLADYGQASQLDILDARVSVNQDSALLFQLENQIQVLYRQLNRLAGWQPDREWVPEDSIEINANLDLDSLWELAQVQNIDYRLARHQAANSFAEIEQARSAFYPLVNASASYGYNKTSNEVGFLLAQRTLGTAISITLQYPIFNGNLRKQQIELAQVRQEQAQMNQKIVLKNLQRDLYIAFDNYAQALELWRLQRHNLESAELNLQRNQEALARGQINSLQFRTAQLNWEMASEQVTLAKNQAKITELELMRLTGELVK